MKKQTALFFYILGFYVILQFSWWGYHLIDLTTENEHIEARVSKKIFMILSEGMVFFVILIIGLWKIRSAIRKELSLSQRQNNFLLSVTHELKTPLTATKLYLQTLLKRDFEESKRKDLLEKTILENQRLETMIDNILNASRLENQVFVVHKEDISLKVLFEDIRERFNKYLQKTVIELDMPADVKLYADRFMVEAIVNNLIDNAVKYAGIDKKIWIYCFVNEKSKCVFGVKDEGPGIAEAFQTEIFLKFTRIGNEDTRMQKGTGLGLFIVSEFVRMQNGKISYKCNDPSGANFEIVI